MRKVFEALHDNVLFINLKKCSFMTNKVLFLGYVVSFEGVHVFKQKIQAIREWPTYNSLVNNILN